MNDMMAYTLRGQGSFCLMKVKASKLTFWRRVHHFAMVLSSHIMNDRKIKWNDTKLLYEYLGLKAKKLLQNIMLLMVMTLTEHIAHIVITMWKSLIKSKCLNILWQEWQWNETNFWLWGHIMFGIMDYSFVSFWFWEYFQLFWHMPILE